ncbi:MAG: redox-sensing transcriptional repressor Rex, partial [Firmicutes bacterium]|nr:redox-sensing transcriptional repressor Rex [Bacillota bacterium]
MPRGKPPDVVIKRLASYLRLLEEHEFTYGPYISSQELGELAGVTPAQVRKDLDTFGEFGKQGVGYPVAALRQEIRGILKVDRPSNIAIIGMGELGSALARYIMRRESGRPGPFRVVALFDTDPHKIGRTIGEVPVEHVGLLADAVRHRDIRIAILTVPARAAQDVLDAGVAAGVRLFLN